MPRRRRLRKVIAPPGFKGYKPYGANHSKNEFIELLYEEYEAIKLSDYDFMNHETAAKVMGISRPTFARIYESARRKIAKAMVEVKEIRTVYGNALLDKNWYECHVCNARFTIPKTQNKHCCAMCSSININLLKNDI
ncbi:DUF134 domain-containing protein [Plebeiibacterium marinum]|uniref:DUF134 domain-containing protein n=1 Tax=Plebeiibacterium marinum TaxID=2992111 RepID=A0AAE3MFN1_9BACT|nr:DUF134 domain-containing protein [Plebeiobacterium marinum]MCW3806715.1 DUF134 domain-containing protein [Plebeiobacterium marinum]